MPPKISHNNVDAVDEAGEGDLKEEDEVRIIQIVNSNTEKRDQFV